MTHVYIRKKPLLENDKEIVHIDTDNSILIEKKYEAYDGRNKTKILNYKFNGVFNSDINNTHIYNSIIKKNLDYDFTCFMYGQTGSGKTYTVLGSNKNNTGIFIKIGEQLIQENNCVFLSAYQIYNEEIKDLLNHNAVLKMYETGHKKFTIPGLVYKPLYNSTELYDCLSRIKKYRSDGVNQINSNSSRSHAILIYSFIKNNKTIKIRVIDLAGNERSYNSNIYNFKSRQENKYINSSLFALKECIRTIDSNSQHIPFRRSKLTSVLRSCFINEHKSIMIATICSNSKNYSDIINTLNYAFKVNKCLKKPIEKDYYTKIRQSKQKFLPQINTNLKKPIENIIILDDEIRIESTKNVNNKELFEIIKQYKAFLNKKIKSCKSTIQIADNYIDNYANNTADKFLDLLDKQNQKNMEHILNQMKIMEKIRKTIGN
jgi:kinesin family member 2/24